MAFDLLRYRETAHMHSQSRRKFLRWLALAPLLSPSTKANEKSGQSKTLALPSMPQKSPASATGHASLDEHLGPLVPGELTIFAGRPFMGTTQLAVATALHCSHHLHQRVQVTTLHERACYWRRKMLGETKLAARPRSRIHFQAALERIDFADDWRRVNHHSVFKVMRERVEAHCPNLMIVDMGVSTRFVRHMSDRSRGEVIGSLHQIAKSFGAHLIICTWLMRELDQREDRRPQIKDLEAGIRERADSVVLLHRPSALDFQVVSRDTGRLQGIVAKRDEIKPIEVFLRLNQNRRNVESINRFLT